MHPAALSPKVKGMSDDGRQHGGKIENKRTSRRLLQSELRARGKREPARDDGQSGCAQGVQADCVSGRVHRGGGQLFCG